MSGWLHVVDIMSCGLYVMRTLCHVGCMPGGYVMVAFCLSAVQLSHTPTHPLWQIKIHYSTYVSDKVPNGLY